MCVFVVCRYVDFWVSEFVFCVFGVCGLWVCIVCLVFAGCGFVLCVWGSWICGFVLVRFGV